MPITQHTFETLVSEDSEGRWELHRGKLREKPEMTAVHNEVIWRLLEQIVPQLPRPAYQCRMNAPHLTLPGGFSYVPDLAIIPTELVVLARSDPHIESYREPVPLIVETWSPSTGHYDVDAKIPGYQLRGDLEIWRIHPLQRTLTVWRRRADGSYDELQVDSGSLRLHALPEVTIDLDALFG